MCEFSFLRMLCDSTTGFTVSDLDFTMKFIVEAVTADAAQKLTMDVNHDNKIDSADSGFIMKVLAKKYRWLIPVDTSKELGETLMSINGCTVSVKLRDSSNAPETNSDKAKVRLEVGTKMANTNSVKIMMDGPDEDGVLTAVIAAPDNSADEVGFVVPVETFCCCRITPLLLCSFCIFIEAWQSLTFVTD